MNSLISNVPEADKFAAQLKNCVMKGQYKKGVDLVKKILKKHPDDFFFTYQYAKLLGDWADDLPAKRRNKLKTEAAGILKPLTKKLSGKASNVRFGVCLNYYYQTYSFRDMYNYGKRFAASDRRQGLYAQALGAGLLAEELYFNKAPGHGKKWAEKSVQIWQKYNLKGEAYYFPFYCMAMSLNILDDPKQALKNLQMAARVSHLKVDCAEFKKLHQLIKAKLMSTHVHC